MEWMVLIATLTGAFTWWLSITDFGIQERNRISVITDDVLSGKYGELHKAYLTDDIEKALEFEWVVSDVNKVMKRANKLLKKYHPERNNYRYTFIPPSQRHERFLEESGVNNRIQERSANRMTLSPECTRIIGGDERILADGSRIVSIPYSDEQIIFSNGSPWGIPFHEQQEPIDQMYHETFKDTKLHIKMTTRDEWYVLEDMKPITELSFWSQALKFIDEKGETEIHPVLKGLEGYGTTETQTYVSYHSGLHEREVTHSYKVLPDGLLYSEYSGLHRRHGAQLEPLKTIGGRVSKYNNSIYDDIWYKLRSEKKTKLFNPVTGQEMELTNLELLRFMILLRIPEFRQAELDEQRAEEEKVRQEEERIGNLKYEILMKHEDRVREQVVSSVDGNDRVKEELRKFASHDEELFEGLIEEIQSKQFTKSDYFDIVDEALTKEENG